MDWPKPRKIFDLEMKNELQRQDLWALREENKLLRDEIGRLKAYARHPDAPPWALFCPKTGDRVDHLPPWNAIAQRTQQAKEE